MLKGRVLQLFVLGVFGCGALGQNLVSNASFETGSSSPQAWSPSGMGVWENIGRTGNRSVSIAGVTGSSQAWFASPSVPVESGKAYVVRFWGASSNMTRGFCVAGFWTASRDFYNRPGSLWSEYSYVAWIPSSGQSVFNIGTFDGNGKLMLDDVEVLPLNPVHKRVGNYRLGEGESLSAGRYEFRSQYGAYGGNYARPLSGATSPFNTYRWYFEPGKQVVYRHNLARQSFTNVQITCGIQNYNNITSTSLWVEASRDGLNWQFAGGMVGTNVATFNVPVSLLPASELFVRLGTAATPQFALTNYLFAANVPDVVTSAAGETHHWGQWLAPTNVQLYEVSSTTTGKLATLIITNLAATNQTFTITARAEFNGTTRDRVVPVEIPAGGFDKVNILLRNAGFGVNTLTLQVRDGANILRLHESLRHMVSILEDNSYGESLAGPSQCQVWWCAGPYKVGQTRLPPETTNAAVRVTAARNEYEPFQLVLRPTTTLSNVSIRPGSFVGLTNGAIISGTNVTVCRAEYVNVSKLMWNETFSVTGPHPDPLAPLSEPFVAGAGTNCPLWFTVHVPKEAPGGEYEAAVTVRYDGGRFVVPVRLRVYDFALTDVTHTRTAYGAIPQYQWHGLTTNTTLAQEMEVWELYLENMARHRISPFYPQWYDRILANYNSSAQTFTHDFTRFDAAMEKYLEEFNFTSFKDINYERELPNAVGIPRFTAGNTAINPAYRSYYTKLMQPIAQHLRERGWIDRAYSFWLDEPQAGQYPLVQDGMLMIEEMAPDLGRLQSEFSGPSSVLNASIWLPQWPFIDLVGGKWRQAAGEELWFYFCTNPRAPAPNNFIDHPAINHRIRSWYGEKFDFDGEAYYGINYYLGPVNPWVEAMSFTAYTNGGIVLWGNGDGTLVYPPVKEMPASPVIAGPCDSVRWELIRDGMEDREYFWLLERALKVAEARLGANHPAVLEGRAARVAALDPLPMPTEYPYEPEQLLAARQRVAEAIEALDDGAPFIAKEPLSKVVMAGGSERLRIEAVGWPPPDIQWQYQGANIPGATSPKLSLTNITVGMAGEYRAIASNFHGAITSAVGRLTVLTGNQPPVVIQDPVSLNRTNGGRAVFGVGVSSLTPFRYQWRHNDVSLPGATNVTLVLTNVGAANLGLYSVIASNGFGAATSAPAQLNLVPPDGMAPPTIVGQPTNQTVVQGQTAQFTVSAVGSLPMSYQWFFNQSNAVAGANASTLWITNVQSVSVGNYTVHVTNAVGALTSAPASLQLQPMPNYTTEPPGLVGDRQGINYSLALPPDNRTRTVLVSTNLQVWNVFSVVEPSAGLVVIPVAITNAQPRFFRVRITP